jgi:hypothetical protein
MLLALTVNGAVRENDLDGVVLDEIMKSPDIVRRGERRTNSR